MSIRWMGEMDACSGWVGWVSEGPWEERLRGLVRVEVELQGKGDEDDELREDGRDDLIRARVSFSGWGEDEC